MANHNSRMEFTNFHPRRNQIAPTASRSSSTACGWGAACSPPCPRDIAPVATDAAYFRDCGAAWGR